MILSCSHSKLFPLQELWVRTDWKLEAKPSLPSPIWKMISWKTLLINVLTDILDN